MSTNKTTRTDAALLEAARKMVEEADRKKGPTIAKATFDAPILIHVLRDGFSLEHGLRPKQYKRGAEITVKPEDVENVAWTDRDGNNTFLERLDEGNWIKRGPFPTWQRSFGEYGGWAWREGQLAAVLAAKKLGDPERRAAAEAEIRRYFGPARGDVRDAHEFYVNTIFPERVAWTAEHLEADE